MEDPFWNAFLQQLDGTHTREDLAQFVASAMGKSIEEAQITLRVQWKLADGVKRETEVRL